MESPDISKKESAKVKSCHGRAARSVMALFRQSVYYNHNRVEFGEFEHVRERADEIDWYVSPALNRQRKRFKGSLVPLLKGLVAFASMIVAYKGSSVSTKFRPEPVAGKALV
jgi:hypothetical protein